MLRRFLGVVGLLLVFVQFLQAQGEVVFSIESEPVTKEEFLYQWRKTNMPLDDFLESYIDFKLKVYDAEREGKDTTVMFRSQYAYLNNQLLKRIAVDAQKELQEKQRLYASNQQRMQTTEWIKLAHISVRIPQHANSYQETLAKQWIDSVYTVLQKGADFDQLMKRIMQNSSQKDLQIVAEVLPWIPVDRHLNEWKDQLATLQRQRFSAPFYSPKGIHILKWIGHQSTAPYEEVADELSFRLEKKGKMNPAVDLNILSSWLQKGIDGLNQSSSLVWQQREIHDALLVSSFSQKDEREQVIDDAVLEQYYKQHKDQYAWKLPRFKGAVIHAKNKKIGKSIKKYLKGVPMENWKRDFDRLYADKEQADAIMEFDLFELGKNDFVDDLVFKCTKAPRLDDYPYAFVMGKKMKKGPTSFMDVKSLVLQDYQKENLISMTKQLRKKYHVEIYSNVLKTVNNDGRI